MTELPLSQPKPLPIRERPVWFRPGTFLLGLAGMLVALSCLGYWLGRRNWHPGFTRFIPAISPETFYYPTVAEMSAIVRARCRPGQVLVIVGGNSIFYGSGQPAELMWTRRLQALLGDRYCVVNLAFRGASAMDGAGVVAEVLRREFPRQIYLTNIGTIDGTNPLGSDPFRFIFWEAYYKGELINYAPRNAYARSSLAGQKKWIDTVGRVWLDRALHFRDLWNWTAMNWFFTVPNRYYPTWHQQFQARNGFADQERNFDEIPFDERFPRDTLAVETQITRGCTESHYMRTKNGGWQLLPRDASIVEQDIRATMPAPLRRRTLVVISKNSPFYVSRLTSDEQKRDAQSYRDSIALWEAAGYRAMTYPDNITADDFGDRAHLTVSGGRKLATVVAEQVSTMAKELGYLSPVAQQVPSFSNPAKP